MKIEIELDDRMVTFGKKWFTRRMLPGALIVGVLIPLALYADVPHLFESNTIISSSEVNDNFSNLDERIGTYEGAISVDEEGRVGVGSVESLTGARLSVNGAIRANNHLTHLPWYTFGTPLAGPWTAGYMKLITPIIHNEGNIFVIRIMGYRYGMGGTPVSIQCGGYAYSGGSLMSTGCHTEGTDDPVGIGVENGVVIITIGSGESSWYEDRFTAEYVGWYPKNAEDFSWQFVEEGAPDTTNTNLVFVDDDSGLITTTGRVGIGTTSPSEMLHVIGNIYATGTVTSGSSRELQKDIRDLDLEDAFETLEQLRVKRFVYKADPEEEHVGFIAEDVPELVASNDRKHLSAMDITAVLTKITQEQQSLLDAQGALLSTQQQRIDRLEAVLLVEPTR